MKKFNHLIKAVLISKTWSRQNNVGIKDKIYNSKMHGGHPNKKNVTETVLNHLLMQTTDLSPVKTEYYLRNSKENSSQYSIDSK